MPRVILARTIRRTGSCLDLGSWAMRCAPIQVTQYVNWPRVRAGLPVYDARHGLASCRRHGVRFRGAIILSRAGIGPIGHIAAFLIS